MEFFRDSQEGFFNRFKFRSSGKFLKISLSPLIITYVIIKLIIVSLKKWSPSIILNNEIKRIEAYANVFHEVLLKIISKALLIIFNKTSWNTFAYASILLISLLRIMEGDHFLSDTIMSFIITYVIIKGLNDIFKNFPEDLNLNRLKKPSWLSRKNSN